MAKTPSSSRDGAKVERFADYDVVTPTFNLKTFARKTPGNDDLLFDEEAIARAEAALNDLSGEFDGWMKSELVRLGEARDRFVAKPDAKTRAALYNVSHDFRGQAATLGFPLAGRVADTLCKVMDALEKAELPVPLITNHVDAIRAIVREDARGESHPIGLALADGLEKAAKELIALLDESPSIAP